MGKWIAKTSCVVSEWQRDSYSCSELKCYKVHMYDASGESTLLYSSIAGFSYKIYTYHMSFIKSYLQVAPFTDIQGGQDLFRYLLHWLEYVLSKNPLCNRFKLLKWTLVNWLLVTYNIVLIVLNLLMIKSRRFLLHMLL